MKRVLLISPHYLGNCTYGECYNPAPEGLVISRPYRSIFLTPEGEKLAKACKERHRVVRDFLIAIGVDRSVAEQDAEGVEHHVSQATLKRFAEFVAVRS